MESHRLLSTTIYSCAYSPCGRYVAAGDNFGYISVFNFEKALALNVPKWQKSIYSFKANDGPIHSLLTTNDFLVVGGTGPVAAWKWADVLERKPAMSWTLDEPCQGGEGSFVSSDVNTLACDGKKVYAGRDDNVVCIWDIASRKCEQKLAAHTDFIHDITIIPSNNSGIISASEDGSVKVWDIRAAHPTTSFEPHADRDLSRPQFGKWISCVSVDENGQWMACGGGPQLSMWHLRSQNRVAVLERPEFTPYIVKFHENVIVAGGNGNALHHWYTNGKEKASIPCTVGTVFSLSFNKKQRAGSTPMVAAGSDYKLDVFCNLSYRSHTLSI